MLLYGYVCQVAVSNKNGSSDIKASRGYILYILKEETPREELSVMVSYWIVCEAEMSRVELPD
jgi:hypothetical protein